MSSLTSVQLKQIFYYDVGTGIFTNKRTNKVLGYKDERGYLKCRIFGKYYRLHRLVWLYEYGYLPKNDIDHINQIKDDNRLCNLRVVEHKINSRNQKKHNTNTTGVSGVYKYGEGRWRVMLRVENRLLSFGIFDNIVEAINMRKEALRTYGFSETHGGYDDNICT